MHRPVPLCADCREDAGSGVRDRGSRTRAGDTKGKTVCTGRDPHSQADRLSLKHRDQRSDVEPRDIQA
jgi:hypothetical protein